MRVPLPVNQTPKQCILDCKSNYPQPSDSEPSNTLIHLQGGPWKTDRVVPILTTLRTADVKGTEPLDKIPLKIFFSLITDIFKTRSTIDCQNWRSAGHDCSIIRRSIVVGQNLSAATSSHRMAALIQISRNEIPAASKWPVANVWGID